MSPPPPAAVVRLAASKSDVGTAGSFSDPRWYGLFTAAVAVVAVAGTTGMDLLLMLLPLLAAAGYWLMDSSGAAVVGG